MKKPFFLSLFLLLLVSCKPDCSEYELTAEEKAFIPYNVGDKAIFRNDVTVEFDTMEIISKGVFPINPPQDCSMSLGRMEVDFSFKKIASGVIVVRHSVNQSENKKIGFSAGKTYTFTLKGGFQTLTVNNVTYNDILIVSIDSNSIEASHIPYIPWQINYSQSKGFLRFHLRNNIIWSKL